MTPSRFYRLYSHRLPSISMPTSFWTIKTISQNPFLRLLLTFVHNCFIWQIYAELASHIQAHQTWAAPRSHTTTTIGNKLKCCIKRHRRAYLQQPLKRRAPFADTVITASYFLLSTSSVFVLSSVIKKVLWIIIDASNVHSNSCAASSNPIL